MFPRECTYSMRKCLIYAIWSCEALGSLQIDIAPPHQISLCPLLLGGRTLGLTKSAYHGWLSMMTSSEGHPFLSCLGPPNLKPTSG